MQNSGTRLWAILTTLAGLTALSTMIAFQMLPEVKVASDCLPDRAVLLFEFAETPQDLSAIFGESGSPCRKPAIAAMDAVNTVDIWAFIPAYTTFIIFGALFLSEGRHARLVALAVGLAIIAATSDYVETTHLLAFTPDLTPTIAELATSSTAAWVKFAALAANAGALAALCFTAAKPRWILGVLLCLPAVGVTMMATDLRWIPVQTLAFFLSWVLLMALSAKKSITGNT